MHSTFFFYETLTLKNTLNHVSDCLCFILLRNTIIEKKGKWTRQYFHFLTRSWEPVDEFAVGVAKGADL